MRMALKHHDKSTRRPARSLLFAMLVILMALVISAGSLGNMDAASQGDDNSVFSRIAQERFDGEEVFNRVCSSCHSIDRPENTETEPLAPPMRMVARRYLMVAESTDVATSRVIEWLKGPDAEKSLMPSMAIEHHGLMPPVVLTDAEREAVAGFVMTLAEGQAKSGGHHHGQSGNS